MIIFKNAVDITSFLTTQRNIQQIGFVPTMGALHAGHLSLVERCKRENGIAVCSIFINPTQFNNADDFKHYPVTIEKDIQLLIKAGCDLLFLPPVSEIYPYGYQKKIYELGKIESILEGFHRPGHFQGVCQVVDRLLEIIVPQRLYMGQKDYQQCLVIHKLLELSGKAKRHELVIEPTIRETNGLAMSSRNMRLSAEEHQRAAAIFKCLRYSQQQLPFEPISEIKKHSKEILEKEGFIVDYVEIADATTLEPAVAKAPNLVGLIAATINKVRLIDNLLLN